MLLCISLTACPEASAERRYLSDRAYRRARLESSLVNRENDYSRLRLRHYAADWDTLSEWNPRVTPIDSDEPPRPLDLFDPDLGEKAFFRYPVQFWQNPATDGHGGAPLGLVRVDVAGGRRTAIAATCATCHATVRDRQIVVGLANDSLDVGWGPGRMDVSTTDGHEPVRIPDLRAIRWLSHLHADATVRQPDVIALAIRLETLLITAHFESVRPPRQVTLALAKYLWSLAPPPPRALRGHGAQLFEANCARCHGAPAFSGAPVPIEQVGTDATVGRSRDRGTGFYRPPSLRGVRDRSLLLHDGSVRSLEELLDPARSAPGHLFGTGLTDVARAELVAYVRSL